MAQLVESGLDEQADATVDSMPHANWTLFEPHRSSVVDVPRVPGVIRVRDGNSVREVLVTDLADWLTTMRDDLCSAQRDNSGHRVDWWAGSPKQLIERLRAVQGPRVALRQGKPIQLRKGDDWDKVPQDWGLYRIHRKNDDTYYVGISSNLRRRLQAHRRNDMFNLNAGDAVEVLPAKLPDDNGVITWPDLQKAEEDHIARLRERGKTVINITKGGNGNPPRKRFNGLVADHLTVQAVESAIPLQRPSGLRMEHIDLGLTWNRPDRDWDLWLREDGRICAAPDGQHSPPQREGPVPLHLEWLQDRYERRYGRDLVGDLKFVGWEHACPVSLPVIFWSGDRRTTDRGLSHLDLEPLREMSADDVRARRLPAELARQGLAVDEAFAVANHINDLVRVQGAGGKAAYIKTEENRHAVRSEVLVSLLWSAMRWRGIPERSVANHSQDVVVSPELGAGGIRDIGTLASVFRYAAPETTETLRVTRPGGLKRVGLQELRLHDDQDVVRFVLLNAVTGNTDRHARNLHLGSSGNAEGLHERFLLPLDHGRCVFNNNPAEPGRIHGDPIDAVLGRVPYANPHQLLRPLVELTARDMEVAMQTGVGWLSGLETVLQPMLNDPDWVDYREELDALAARVVVIGDRLDVFFDECAAVVVP